MTEINKESEVTFADLWLSKEILEAIEAKWYKKPSPIQAWVIPLLLNWDKDIVWQAQTGTGKTAAFGLPLLSRIDRKSKDIKWIILCPTRELAIQVATEIESFSPKNSLKIQLLYWGQPIRDEMRWLRNNPHLIVWTPGRVKDHLNKKRLDLSKIDYFVLDEADEMLNIGFREEIEEIFKETPKEKKVLLFSATMPKAIMGIVKSYMRDYDLVAIKSANLTNKNITQQYFEVSPYAKFDALTRIIEMQEEFYAIIFCRTKMDVDEVASKLMSKWYKAEWIHGDIEQKMREKILARYKEKKINVLVATDVAARGIDVTWVTHVINYSLPENPETYTHRIGRTGRAGNKWAAITFVTRAERRKIGYYENTIKAKIERGTLPKIAEVIEMKKKHLTEEIKESIENHEENELLELANKMLELHEKPEVVLSALLKKFYGKEFSTEHYSEIRESRGGDDRNSRASDNWEYRLFIAKWRKDWMNAGWILKLIWDTTWVEMWNAWKIDIMDSFSFMNIPEAEGEIILQTFKKLNSNQPLVVKAKNSWGGWQSRWGYRGGSRNGGWYRGWSRNWWGYRWGWDRGWYRWNSSRGRNR